MFKIGLVALAVLAGAAEAQQATPDAQVLLLDLLAYERPINLGETPLDEARDRVRRNPRSADAWHDLGESLDLAGDLDGAIRAYERATKLPPHMLGRAYLYRELAEARERSGDLPGALEAARVSVRSWPKSRDGLHCAGYEEKMLVRILVETPDVAGAVTFYRPLYETDPDWDECRSIWEALQNVAVAGSQELEKMRE